MKQNSCFHCFYTNNTFKTSCKDWIDTGIHASGDGEVPVVTQYDPGSSRLLKVIENAQGLSTSVEPPAADGDAPRMTP